MAPKRLPFRLDQAIASLNDDSSGQLCGDVVVNDFQSLTAPVPFVVNPCGYISNLSAVTYSRQGVPMQSFRLQDSSGKYVSCCAHGRHCESEAIEDRALVVIFFACGAAGLGNAPGMLWLYDDCHVVLQRRQCIMPPAVKAITIGAGMDTSAGS